MGKISYMSEEEFRAQAKVLFEAYLDKVIKCAGVMDDVLIMIEDSGKLFGTLLNMVESSMDDVAKKDLESDKKLLDESKDMQKLCEETKDSIYKGALEALRVLKDEEFERVTQMMNAESAAFFNIPLEELQRLSKKS